MKTQNNLDANILSISRGESVRNVNIEHERRLRSLSFFAGIAVGFNVLTEKSIAAVQWHKDPQSGAIECTQKDEQTGKQVKLHFGTKEDIGKYPSLQRIDSPFVRALKTVGVKMPYVNEHIQDPVAWRNYAWDETEKLGASYENRSQLTAQETVELAVKIVKKNLRYENDLLNENATLTKKIDSMPIDKVLMEAGIGVCRHFSVLVDKVYEIFSDDPECRMLANTFMRRLITKDGYHAINLIGDARDEGKDSTTITLSSIDTTVGKKVINVGSLYLDDFNIKKYESAAQQKDALYPFYTQYLDPIFDKKEKLDSKKFFYEETTLAGFDKLLHDVELTFLYLGAVEDLTAKGRTAETKNVFDDFKVFLKDHKVEIDREVLKDEYDLLYSVFFNIYKTYANAQNDPTERGKIQHEGEALRLNCFAVKYEALLKEGELKKALKLGEDYADFLAQTGDTAGAEKIYHQLLDTYQKHASELGAYERSMPRDNSEYALFIKIEPFKDEESLQKYLQYKKERIWKQK
ncbi:MAG: hypothetical protein Q8P56_03585 [Candidatus Uhrbacteria bacterium]|nr:hypothetical protein [Candidatus Uhrbacteria bacterium]